MSDYISREAAVKIAQKYGLVNGSALGRHTGLADCIAIEIGGLPAADVEPVRRWIPCSERMPEDDKKVLVYIPPCDGTTQYGYYIAQMREVKGDTNNFWGIQTADSPWTVWAWGYFVEPIVTHWMPLPEPPKEE